MLLKPLATKPTVSSSTTHSDKPCPHIEPQLVKTAVLTLRYEKGGHHVWVFPKICNAVCFGFTIARYMRRHSADFRGFVEVFRSTMM